MVSDDGAECLGVLTLGSGELEYSEGVWQARHPESCLGSALCGQL